MKPKKKHNMSDAPDLAACYGAILLHGLITQHETLATKVSGGFELQDYGLAVAFENWPTATARRSIRKQRRALVAQLQRKGRTVLKSLDYELGHAVLYVADPARASVFARFAEATTLVAGLAGDNK